jgi:predicted CoA-binding protein
VSERVEIEPWTPPSDSQRLRILRRTRTVAVVGASSNRSRPSNFVLTYLLSSSTNFTVWPVNPNETEILGQRAYPSLADLPSAPDLVDVFRRPEDLDEVAMQAISCGASTLWLQLGLYDLEVARVAHASGLDVAMDRCLKIEHARFAGGLHLAGFDTGVISSRRELA